MINAIVYSGTTIQFPQPPNRDEDAPSELIQTSALASDGSMYVYNKALHYRIPHRLTYPQVTSTVLANLRTLHDTIDAGRHTFTWYDHSSGTAHTCRFTAAIKHNQTGPDRHRVELEFEELLPLATPTAASWAAASAAVAGSFPVWIFKLTVNAVDYWLSDRAFAVAGFCPTTLPLVKTWGSIQSGITGGLDEYNISDFSVDLLVDPDTSPNLRDLSLLYEFEQYPVELYLWFHGLNPATAPPRLKWRGYVRNHPEMDDTTLRLECEDESARLTKNLGTLLSSTTYPEADPQDVGKMIPIVIGAVKKLPALGALVGNRTTLPAAITAAAASFAVSDSTGLSGSVIQIDDEQLQVAGVSGLTLTVNRGINGTLPASHSKGGAVWEWKPEYIFIAGEKVNAFDRVYGTIDEIPIDINSVCTRYTGQPGSEHPSGQFPGLAVVSVPGVLSLSQLDGLGVARSGLAAKTGSVAKTGSAAQSGNISDPGHLNTLASAEVTGGTYDTPGLSEGTVGTSGSKSVYGTFYNDAPGNRAAITMTVSVVFMASFTYDWYIILCDDAGNNVHTLASGTGSSNPLVKNYTFEIPSDHLALNKIRAVISSSNIYIGVELQGATRTIRKISSNTDSNTANVTKGTLAVADTIAVADTSDVSDTITPYLTGLATVRSIISHTILCDVSSNIYLPEDVEQDLLTRAGGGALTVVGTYPDFYRFDGALTEHKPARYWLDSIAFQCRSWFVQASGVAKMIARPDVLTSIKTLPNCLLSGNKRSLKISKAALSEVINVAACRYNRDYSQPRSAENYRGCTTGRMEESILYYGEKAGAADLFWFDQITDPRMAIHVLGYYLGKHCRRHRIYKFSAALDNEELQFADAITLGFEGNTIVEITAADLSPGDKSRLDTIEITATDIHKEWPYMAEDYYSEDFSLSNS